MPRLFSDYRLKDVTLRNRTATSPIAQYSCGEDGVATDWYMVRLGASFLSPVNPFLPLPPA
ncbi:MAG: oxidoreductase [Belnapia sp.]|jgi:2,4-dienoyl-CoA reductase-like NADH-dependent reductase (Old Yellow Enzyme family)|nr:oxidoreductase [Belnapia sp.]